MKKIILIIVLVAGSAALIWFFSSRNVFESSPVVARQGIHWHADLKIDILGQFQEIPAGLGLEKLPHNPLHTHDHDGVIHMEFAGLVLQDDIKLGKFFQVWKKDFSKNCIFDNCADEQNTLRMLVGGKENSEFENYVMKDGDKIEIIFEKAEEVLAREIKVLGDEFSFSPSSINVSLGEKIKIVFENKGNASHNLIIEGLGAGTKVIGPGGQDVIEFVAPSPGTYTFFCSLPGHRIAGMTGDLIVE